jgi:hypothetical protein
MNDENSKIYQNHTNIHVLHKSIIEQRSDENEPINFFSVVSESE